MESQTDTILVACALSVVGVCFLATICMVISATYCERDFNDDFLEELENV